MPGTAIPYGVAAENDVAVSPQRFASQRRGMVRRGCLVDKKSGLDDAAFLAKASSVIAGRHKTLTRCSEIPHGAGHASAPGHVDLAVLGQKVT